MPEMYTSLLQREFRWMRYTHEEETNRARHQQNTLAAGLMPRARKQKAK